MVLKSPLLYLLLAISVFDVNLLHTSRVDKTLWKPILSRAGNHERQHHRNALRVPTFSQSYTGPQLPMMARPVTYVPPAVTFNPPQVVYGNPSITKAVTSPSMPYRQEKFSSSARYNNNPNYQMTPSYAAPIQPYQYQLVTDQPVIATSPTIPVHTVYQLAPQSSPQGITPKPDSLQYHLFAQGSSQSIEKSYVPSQNSVQLQLTKEAPGDAPSALTTFIPQSIATHPPSTSPTTQSPSFMSTSVHSTNAENATFVDVVTVLSKYFRTTGTQLSEMFTQLSENTELNTWRPWTTPTTTTTPAPTTAQSSNPSPIIVPMVYPIVMPTAQPLLAQSPPPAPVYLHSPPLTVSVPYAQPSFSQHQPMFAHSPTTYSHYSPYFVHDISKQAQLSPSSLISPPPPSHSEDSSERNSINDILTNSIDHDYYYDCDK